MIGWDKETLDLLNEKHLQVTNPGTLSAPVRRLSIHRNDDLNLILETEAAPDTKLKATQPPLGTVSICTNNIEIVYANGVRAVLSGVQTYSVSPMHEGWECIALKETARVHELTVTAGDLDQAAYTIEWLENLRTSPFIWPDYIRTKMEATSCRNMTLSNDGITVSGSTYRESVSSAAAKLIVAGQELYVCALDRRDVIAGIKPGCIVYVGVPSDLVRKKIRTALSFALGIYLVELGHTVYDLEWRILSATSRSAYSLEKRVFKLPPTPLAPLSSRAFRYDLQRPALTRMMNALVSNYETLDLANLSWAYWHACVATVHIAPAHFGAAIEALQRAYIRNHQGEISTKLLTPAYWKSLHAALVGAIASTNTTDDTKRALMDNLSNVNRASQRTMLKAVLQAISIELGTEEDGAWKRRNDAAHGLPIPEGSELAAIRDMKLLTVLFHRMLLRISNAADAYIDYVSLDHPYRRLQEPVLAAPN